MRFCPFCAQENPDDSRECVHCGKRLPAARTPPPRPAAPPREKPAPKVAPRPAPRSLPLKPAEGADAQLAVDPPTTQTTLPAERPRSVTPPPPERPRTLTPAPPERARTPTPPPIAPVFPPTPLPPPMAPTASPLPEITKPTPMPQVTRPTDVTKPSALPRDRPASLPAPLPPPPSSPTGTVLGMSPPNSERRSTKPLEIPASKAEASLPGLANDVRDDATTTPNPRLDEDLASSDDGKTVPDIFSKGRPARDDSMTLPKPRKAVVTRLESARRPVSPLEQEKATIDAPDDKPSITYQSTEPSPPVLDGGNTPYLPTLALPAMPAGPSPPNLFGSVKYLLPLARAMLARKKAQRSIRQLLVDDQHLLDQVLKDLGKAAREHDLDVPAIADEMRKVKAEEQRRAQAEADSSKADDEMGREDARWNGDEAERKSEITRREAELKETEDELRGKGDERRGHEAERARLEGLIRAAEKRSSQAQQQAQKAEVTPPEKGGGPNTAANLRMQAQEAQKEATSHIAPRDEARAKAEALDAPIHTLTQKIVDQRAQLAQKRKELADAGVAHKKALAGLEADKQRAAKERSDAEREMSQRFVNVGTMLNLHRVEDNAYKDLYARIDELKGGLNAREAAIVRLESELRTYDRRAVQTGLIIVGAVFFTLVLVAILLAVLLSR